MYFLRKWSKPKENKRKKKLKIEIKIIENNFEWLRSNHHYDLNERENENETIIKVLQFIVPPRNKAIAFQSDNTIR